MKTLVPIIGMYTLSNIYMELFAKIVNGILVINYFCKMGSSFMFHRVLISSNLRKIGLKHVIKTYSSEDFKQFFVLKV